MTDTLRRYRTMSVFDKMYDVETRVVYEVGGDEFVKAADVERVVGERNAALEELDQIDYICSAGDIPEQQIISRQGEPDLDFIPTVERVQQLQAALAAKDLECAEWKLIATNEPRDNDQRCQLLINKRKDAEAKLAAQSASYATLEAKYKGAVAALDKHWGTPCEQIRHQQEVEQLQEQIAQLQARIEELEHLRERENLDRL